MILRTNYYKIQSLFILPWKL